MLRWAAAWSSPRLFSVPRPAWTHSAPSLRGAADAGADRATLAAVTAAAAPRHVIILRMTVPSVGPRPDVSAAYYGHGSVRGCTWARIGSRLLGAGVVGVPRRGRPGPPPGRAWGRRAPAWGGPRLGRPSEGYVSGVGLGDGVVQGARSTGVLRGVARGGL